MRNIYFFQWPSDLGGADTRLKELIQCFSFKKEYNLFCIPNDSSRILEEQNIEFLKQHNVNILTWGNLPSKLEGYAIAFCNFRLFSEKWRLEKIKNLGLKFIWSNDMMWTTKEESDAANNLLIDAVIFTSEFHKKHLLFKNPAFSKIENQIIPNYFHYPNYRNKKISKKESLKDKFVIGKLCRADWAKYSENFPLFYDNIPIPNKYFRFMGWDEKLSKKYAWFKFNNNFELLEVKQESNTEFLSQLDLYLFNCHHNYIENQSRSIIESQLLGIPCIAPKEGNFPNMIWHQRTGFLFETNEECYKFILKIYNDKNLYNILSENAKNFSKLIWCDQNQQIEYWEKLFELL